MVSCGAVLIPAPAALAGPGALFGGTASVTLEAVAGRFSSNWSATHNLA